jgi:ACR3 family arsenite efflux pump ArsB
MAVSALAAHPFAALSVVIGPAIELPARLLLVKLLLWARPRVFPEG